MYGKGKLKVNPVQSTVISEENCTTARNYGYCDGSRKFFKFE